MSYSLEVDMIHEAHNLGLLTTPYVFTVEDAEAMTRVLALYRMSLDDSRLDPGLAGRPIYLILAANKEKLVRVKPQNLVTGLPLRAEAVAG